MWLVDGDKPAALELYPIHPDEFGHYIDMFSLLRQRFAKNQSIPISDIVETARAFGYPERRSLIVIAGCDIAWLGEQKVTK